MNLSQLRHLLALAEHESFRKAADSLFLTQSALSRSIQALEDELGVRLIDRNGRKNRLTPYGEHAVRAARRVVVEAAELKRGIDRLLGGDLGSLAIGYGAGPAGILEVSFFRYMANHHPQVRVKAARGAIELLIQSLRTEQLDALVVDRRSLVSADDLRIDPLPPVRGGFMCRAGHPLLAEAPVNLEALQRHPNATTPLSAEVGQSLEEGLGAGAHPDRLMTLISQDVNALLDVVETTDTIFFGIFAAARERMAAGRLVELSTQLPEQLYGKFAVVTLARRTPPPAFQIFSDFVAGQFGSDAVDRDRLADDQRDGVGASVEFKS